jgi:two-component sensor histidine kinase
MVVSELVTNAIRHGRACADAEDCAGGAGSADQARVELSLWCQGSRLICTITDQSCEPPVLVAADFDAETGRGLQVVQALAISWGWRPLSSRGKAVWAAFQIDGIS